VAKHVWSVLCERMLEDPSSKTVSLIDVLEAIVIGAPPPPAGAGQGFIAIPIRMQLVSFWTRSDESAAEEFNLRASLKLPDGKSVSIPAVKIEFSKSNYRQQFAFPTIPYTGPGRYWFRIEGSKDGERWEVAAEIPFEVRLADPSSPSEATAPDKPARKRRKKKYA